MYKVGQRVMAHGINEYIIASVSKPNSRLKKIGLINVKTGYNTGRLVVINDFNDITEIEFKRMFSNKLHKWKI